MVMSSSFPYQEGNRQKVARVKVIVGVTEDMDLTQQEVRTRVALWLVRMDVARATASTSITDVAQVTKIAQRQVQSSCCAVAQKSAYGWHR